MTTMSCSERRCRTCRWWDSSTQSALAEPDTTGLCRRATPGFDDRTGLAVWPMAEDTDWCGEWAEDPYSSEGEDG